MREGFANFRTMIAHNRALNSLKTPLARLPVAREGHLSRSLLNITTRVNDNTTAPVNGNITAPANGVANVSLEGPFDFF